MTAPAEDPRGGEAVCTCWHGSLSGYCRDHDKPRIQIDPGHPDSWGCACPRPAAGRGDTDSSGERPCCGHPNALTDPLHAIPAAGRGDTAGKRPWLFENALTDTVTNYDARNEVLPHLLAFGPSRGDADSSGEAIEPGLSVEANARRLKWFTDAELAAELTRRRALDGA